MTAAFSYKFEDAPALLGVQRSARGYRWIERLDSGLSLVATAIAQANGLPELLGRILAARGADSQTASRYLDPALRTLLPDPATLQDMDKAANRLADAIRNREPVAVFGDYDVDGAASVALIERFLRAHGQGVTTYIPDRLTEGYGPSPAALEGLVQQGATLILTVDCGTGADTAIAAAQMAGGEVIVIDHHQADEALPPATAIVNPNRQDDLSGQGHLAAAGLVFLFLVATTRALRHGGYYQGQAEPDLLGLLDLVALATVCDVVPFIGVNRAFVAKGLAVLRLRHNAGLRALADAARVDTAPSCYTLGFILGPRINAGGRIGAPGLGAKLLACDDEVEARGIAAKLETLNTERKAIEQTMLEEAYTAADNLLASDPDRPSIFLGVERWHKGLLGLVAGRITERFARPAFVVSWEPDGSGTGSARSIASVDLGAAIRAAVHAGLLVKGGGHAMAAGFKLERSKQASFLDFLTDRIAAPVATAQFTRQLKLDGVMSAKGASKDLLTLLDRAGPYGPRHPEPRFVFPSHRISRVRLLKDTHIRCTLQSSDGARLEACAFRVGETPLAELLLKNGGLTLHIAGRLRPTSWNGREGVELLIDDAAEANGA
ncbi:MAG: single-stranded-DNA-specific exonuclease RecJ [Methyloceanibacter sp.]|uniref:single-stranded-DNA-specific exonuclease RecJ n=1 Tax=Methyloceanibacter sp. TaxID=1965321 RepID=UPI003D9B1219